MSKQCISINHMTEKKTKILIVQHKLHNSISIRIFACWIPAQPRNYIYFFPGEPILLK